MSEVLISYLQFLIWQISEYSLLFVSVVLAVPAIWLVLKLTNLIYEEKALSLNAGLFATCSIVAALMFVTNSSPHLFYKPLLLLCIGLTSYIVVPIFFCESPTMELSQRKKTFSLDGVTVPVANVTQVSVSRCFTKTKRSCLMEIFVSSENSRGRSLYYETNDVKSFKSAVNFFKKYVAIDYDCSFSQYSIEIPFFSVAVKTLLLSLFFFVLLLPASQSLNDKRSKMSLPDYKTVMIPKEFYDIEKINAAYDDVIAPIFKCSNPQVIVFDASQSSHFLGNYRKALASHPDQTFDFNIVSIRKSRMYFKHAYDTKVLMENNSENPYTKFITNNCNKLCYLDNDSRLLYRSTIETVDPRAENIQDAVNLLSYVQNNRIEQKRLKLRKMQQKNMDDE